MNKRNINIDLSKGILIILVVLGHSIQYAIGSEWLTSQKFYDDIIFRAIYSFHMPLFMMKWVFVLQQNKKELKLLLAAKLKVIGIPMLTFIILFNIVNYIILYSTY